jgi:hypothetical protein
MDPLTALRQSDVIDIHPRFDQMSKLGIPLDEFNLAVVGFMNGNIAGVWTEGIRKYPILVHLSEEKRDDPEELKNLPVPLPDGVPDVELIEIELQTIFERGGSHTCARGMAGCDTSQNTGEHTEDNQYRNESHHTDHLRQDQEVG